MKMSQAQMNAAVLEAVSKLPNLPAPKFHQIGFSGHGVKLSFTEPNFANEFVRELKSEDNIIITEQSSYSMHLTFQAARPRSIPAHVPDFIYQELMGEIMAKAMSLKWGIQLVNWTEVRFNAPRARFVA